MNAHHNTTVLLKFYINTEYFTINMFWKKKKTSDGQPELLERGWEGQEGTNNNGLGVTLPVKLKVGTLLA